MTIISSSVIQQMSSFEKPLLTELDREISDKLIKKIDKLTEAHFTDRIFEGSMTGGAIGGVMGLGLITLLDNTGIVEGLKRQAGGDVPYMFHILVRSALGIIGGAAIGAIAGTLIQGKLALSSAK